MADWGALGFHVPCTCWMVAVLLVNPLPLLFNVRLKKVVAWEPERVVEGEKKKALALATSARNCVRRRPFRWFCCWRMTLVVSRGLGLWKEGHEERESKKGCGLQLLARRKHKHASTKLQDSCPRLATLFLPPCVPALACDRLYPFGYLDGTTTQSVSRQK